MTVRTMPSEPLYAVRAKYSLNINPHSVRNFEFSFFPPGHSQDRHVIARDSYHEVRFGIRVRQVNLPGYSPG